MNTEMTQNTSFDALLRTNPQLNDPATLQGVADLIGKLAPLLQGKRLHNLIDLLSAVSDVVDMADDAMIQKLMKGYENVVAGAFNISNAMNYASAQAGAEHEPPSLWRYRCTPRTGDGTGHAEPAWPTSASGSGDPAGRLRSAISTLVAAMCSQSRHGQ